MVSVKRQGTVFWIKLVPGQLKTYFFEMFVLSGGKNKQGLCQPWLIQSQSPALKTKLGKVKARPKLARLRKVQKTFQ
jgi:hypothetical protein